MSPAAPEGALASDPMYEDVCVASRTVGSTEGKASAGDPSTTRAGPSAVAANETVPLLRFTVGATAAVKGLVDVGGCVALLDSLETSLVGDGSVGLLPWEVEVGKEPSSVDAGSAVKLRTPAKDIVRDRTVVWLNPQSGSTTGET